VTDPRVVSFVDPQVAPRWKVAVVVAASAATAAAAGVAATAVTAFVLALAVVLQAWL